MLSHLLTYFSFPRSSASKKLQYPNKQTPYLRFLIPLARPSAAIPKRRLLVGSNQQPITSPSLPIPTPVPSLIPLPNPQPPPKPKNSLQAHLLLPIHQPQIPSLLPLQSTKFKNANHKHTYNMQKHYTLSQTTNTNPQQNS